MSACRPFNCSEEEQPPFNDVAALPTPAWTSTGGAGYAERDGRERKAGPTPPLNDGAADVQRWSSPADNCTDIDQRSGTGASGKPVRRGRPCFGLKDGSRGPIFMHTKPQAEAQGNGRGSSSHPWTNPGRGPGHPG
ncbi:hypothetical protein AAVH_08591 [Aphelenchoides avenae]|nr:hypothetical protein AAVH_08591 [Aphelenchus avenae]